MRGIGYAEVADQIGADRDLRCRRGRLAGSAPTGRAVVLSLFTLTLILTACGGSASSSTSTTQKTTSTAVPASASRGCGTAGRAGTVTLSPVVDGRTRTAILHVPPGYRPDTPLPLVVNMHGSQSTAQQQVAFSGMDTTADADGFMVVYPQGAIAAGGGYEWNVPGQPLFGGASVPTTAPDDVSFVEQLVSGLESTYCIDRNRVFATGFSGGARMASQLGCDASTVFGAIAPVSGLRFPAPCGSSRPMPVLSFHGTADPVDPYNGNGQAYWTYSVPAAAQRWAAHDGCAPAPTTSHPAPGVIASTYDRCAGGAVVELDTIGGEGHEWPGGPRLPSAATALLGPQSMAIDASTTMWSFFMAHPL